MGEVLLKLDHCNPTHSFKDRVVAVASAKALEVGADTLACASTGNLGERGRRAAQRAAFAPSSSIRRRRAREARATAVYGGEMFAVRGSYDDCSRLVVELASELDWAFVNVNLRAYYAEGSKTLAFEIAEQLGWDLPDAVVAPIASGSLFTKLWQGSSSFSASVSSTASCRGCTADRRRAARPVGAAFVEERAVTPVRPATVAHSLAIGAPADGDLAIATARASGGAIHSVPEEDVGANMALLAGASGVFGETAAGVTLGALRAAVASGQLGEHDRVVVLVTGTGLKTPTAVDVGASAEIAADVDELLDRLGVAV